MVDNNALSFPEEEEDLEALRLAALQSLKKKASGSDGPPTGPFGKPHELGHFNGSPRSKSKRGKFGRPQSNRTTRNVQFSNGWNRNSNLISVQMVNEPDTIPESCPKIAPPPKLILPQDRYCKPTQEEEKCDGTSKFDRYKDSDESESDSDDESKSGESSPIKRSDSLEAIMAELENEIQGGEQKPKEDKPKTKSPKKARKISISVENESPKITEPSPTEGISKENLKPEISEPPVCNETKLGRVKSFSKVGRKWQGKSRRHNPGPPPLTFSRAPPPALVSFPVPVQTFPTYNPYDNGVYVPPLIFDAPPPLLPVHVPPPPVFERPLSPLIINTGAYTTSTLAPLSPRSAAFVLENRAIVEKRRRRSYSRSPSPLRFRRSKSPRRVSLSPPKRRSLSTSPVRRVLTQKAPSSPKKSTIHERLGVKSSSNPSRAEPESDKPKKLTPTRPKEKKPEVLDPVLEARRRKFERNEITQKEGVIRLKLKEEEAKKNQLEDSVEELDEEALLEEDDTIVLDHKMDGIFSDEESDSDNEGRFKTKQETNQKVPILPFTKLINGQNEDIKSNLKVSEGRRENKRSDSRKRYRSRSPLHKRAKLPRRQEKIKSLISTDSKKIEIKIRNPAKYKRSDEEKKEELNSSGGRKVEIGLKETEDLAKAKNVEDTNLNINEGDLRAQLSRKRAERQKEIVPSRLLQNALQGVGVRKGKKKSKSKEEVAEGRLPIHLRLGASEVLGGNKSRKHKKGSLEQVLCFVASLISFLVG